MAFVSEIQDYVTADKQLCVLVVDDSKTVRQAIRQVLELVSIRVHEAEDGKAALQSVYEHVPDLVVLDIEMPGMNGISVLKAIRNTYSKIELPVVMVTSHDSSSEIVAALDYGASDYITKPLDFDVMWARISNQLMQKQAAEYIQIARQQLEKQVRQRTAELATINLKLKREIKQRTIAQEKLKKQANYDQLTGLPNRHLAVDRLRQVISKAQRQELYPCVAYLDLDNFKTINDTLGHAAGDGLLRETAKRLTACARKSDTVSRLGGDEFMIILDDDGNEPENMREHAVSRVGDRIIESFSKPFVLDGMEVSVTTSIGFAIYGKDGEDGNTLMRHADESMYRSKKEGKNLYCFYSPEMMAKNRIRHMVESRLREAFLAGKLCLVYQPAVIAGSGEICFIEASVCLGGEEAECLPTGILDSVAEDTGLDVPIGEWQLRSVCRQIREWREQEYTNISVSLKMSAHQLEDGNIVKVIDEALRANSLAANLLQIEISESTLSNESAVGVVEQLQKMGVSLSLDGFNADHAPISMLQKHRFSGVRFEQQYVVESAGQDNQGDLVRAVVALSGVLGLKLVCSGIEDADQFERVRTCGCYAVQGNYISKPLPADSIRELLQRRDSGSGGNGQQLTLVNGLRR